MKIRLSINSMILTTIAILAFGSAATAWAQAVELGDGVAITAEVVAIDRVDRSLALLGPKGNVLAIEVGSDVRNFDQIQIGDMVKVMYFESIALYVGMKGEKPDASAGLVAARTPKGDKPGGVIAESIDVSAKVAALDKGKRSLTLELPDGRKVTTKVDPAVKAFDTLKVGDSIHVRYTEAVAISVDKQ